MATTIPVDPKLPPRFDDTPNDQRPKSHDSWWASPFIRTERFSGDKTHEAEWLSAWPTGVRYDVRCLDGGAWDRTTWLGSFPTLSEAIDFANSMVETGEIERRLNTFSAFAGVGGLKR